MEALKQAGISYTDAPVYETWTDFRRKEELNRVIQDVDYVAAASGSAVRAMKEMLKDGLPKNAKMIAIGPVTAKEAEKAGLPVYDTAGEYTAAGIAAAILADQRQR